MGYILVVYYRPTALCWLLSSTLSFKSRWHASFHVVSSFFPWYVSSTLSSVGLHVGIVVHVLFVSPRHMSVQVQSALRELFGSLHLIILLFFECIGSCSCLRFTPLASSSRLDINTFFLSLRCSQRLCPMFDNCFVGLDSRHSLQFRLSHNNPLDLNSSNFSNMVPLALSVTYLVIVPTHKNLHIKP